MKQKNSIINKVNNKLTSVNNSIITSVKHDLVLNIIRIVLLLYTAFVVPMLKEQHLKLVENQLFRFIVVAVIIYLSFIDVASALLLTIALLVTIHRAGNTIQSNNVVNNTINNVGNSVNQEPNNTNNVLGNVNVSATDNELEVEKVKENEDNQESIWNRLTDLYQQKDGFESHNNQKINELVKENNVTNVNQEKVEEPVPNNNSNLNGEVLNNNKNNNNKNVLDVNNLPQAYDNETVNNLQVFDDNNAMQKNTNTDPNNLANNNLANNNLANNNNLINALNNEQPASETLTDNILRAQNNNTPRGLTTGEHLNAVQENAVPGTDLLSDDEVKTLQNMHTAQGLGDGIPMGYKAKRYDGYHFKQGDQQNLVHNMMRNEYL